MFIRHISICIIILAILFAYISHLHAEEIWFGNISKTHELSDRDNLELVSSIYKAINKRNKTVSSISHNLNKYQYPNIVFISASDGVSAAHVGLGRGKDLVNATNNALRNLYEILPGAFDPKWLKIDIVKNVRKIENYILNNRINFDPTLSGIAFNQESGIAILPEELSAGVIVNSGVVNRYSLVNYLNKKPNRYRSFENIDYWGENLLYVFNTESYFYDGEKLKKLYRGHDSVIEINPERLLYSAKLAGDYLKRSILPDGSYLYRYIPEADILANDYNILRHAGATYSMLELYEVTRDIELLQKAELAINYIKKFTKECRIEDIPYQCVVDEPNYLVKIGGNALAAIVISKYIEVSGDKSLLPFLERINDYIIYAQKDNGEFYPHMVEFFTGNIFNMESDYYPGEAMLGLLRAYKLTKEKKLLDTAEKAADYIINVRDKDKTVENINHDHWFIYAINELYRLRKKRIYLDHAYKIADAMLNSQILESDYPDYIGGYNRIPGSTSAATRSEALFTLYNLAIYADDIGPSKKYLDAVKRGVKFQLSTQYVPENVLYLRDPQQAIGGFKGSYYSSEIQNDYVQHNLSSIIGLYKILISTK